MFYLSRNQYQLHLHILGQTIQSFIRSIQMRGQKYIQEIVFPVILM